MLDQLGTYRRKAAQSHIKNNRLVFMYELLPFKIDDSIFWVPGDEPDRLRIVPVSQWYARIGRTTRRSGYAWNDLERNTFFSKRFNFLATTTKDEWITSLETTNSMACPGESNQFFVDGFLGRGFAASFLANIFFLMRLSMHGTALPLIPGCRTE